MEREGSASNIAKLLVTATKATCTSYTPFFPPVYLSRLLSLAIPHRLIVSKKVQWPATAFCLYPDPSTRPVLLLVSHPQPPHASKHIGVHCSAAEETESVPQAKGISTGPELPIRHCLFILFAGRQRVSPVPVASIGRIPKADSSSASFEVSLL